MSDESHMQKTGWKCEICGTAGTVRHVVGASVYEVLHILEDSHSEASDGRCSNLAKMRVWLVPSALPVTRTEE